MKICPHCAYQNKDDALTCVSCHESLVKSSGKAVVDTQWLSKARRDFSVPDEGETEKPPADKQAHEVVLRINGIKEPLVLEVTKTGLILGRTDLDGRVFPDVDLSPFGADECGVSRRHARLVLNTSTYEIEIFDMNSTNGTYINDKRIEGQGNHYLNHGDKVRLGRLFFRFYYRM